jgi:hypothetical protein
MGHICNSVRHNDSEIDTNEGVYVRISKPSKGTLCSGYLN